MLYVLIYTINPKWIPKAISNGREITRKHTSIVAAVLFLVFLVCWNMAPKSEPLEMTDMGYAEETVADVSAEVSDEDMESNMDSTEEAEPETAEEQPMYPVEFRQSVTYEEDKIKIQGTTNLLGGSLIFYEVENLNNVLVDWSGGDMVVSNNGFSAEIDISDFEDGTIWVSLGFLPHKQREDLQARYGANGEYLEGSRVERGSIRYETSFEKMTPIELSGRGDTATTPFDLKEGFAVLEATHQGGSNFAVFLKSTDGQESKLMVNEIGNYSGKTFAIIPDTKEYLLSIEADGNWTANVSQAIPSKREKEAELIEGKGDDVIFIELTSGLRRFEFTHDGDSNFAVMLNGQRLLVNEIGAYSGSMAESIEDSAVYAIVIEADGNWTAIVE